MRNFVLSSVRESMGQAIGCRPRWTAFPAGHGVHRSESNSHPMRTPSPYHPPAFAGRTPAVLGPGAAR